VEECFFYDRVGRTYLRKVGYVAAVTTAMMLSSYWSARWCAALVLYTWPMEGKDIIFYGGVPILFLQLGVIYIALMHNKLHWSTAVAWVFSILAGGWVVIG
jgi:hypothetical protein